VVDDEGELEADKLVGSAAGRGPWENGTESDD